MITIETFYKCYQLYHHRAKAATIYKLLDSDEFIKPEEILNPIYAFTKDDYERMLQVELRANLFHAIETLFTLFFCLQPDKEGNVDDLGLLRNLNKRKFYHDQIRTIALNGESELRSLDDIVNFQGEMLKFGQYLFYFALKKDKLPPGLDDSLEAIKLALFLLAAELSDTSEYNSYKHCLRAVPAFSEISLAKSDTLEILKSFDAKNSMTYFQELKNNSFSYHTKFFDSRRDYNMTLLSSNLIYHIIMSRRASIVSDVSGIPIGYFSKEEVNACAERNKEIIQFSNSFNAIKLVK